MSNFYINIMVIKINMVNVKGFTQSLNMTSLSAAF